MPATIAADERRPRVAVNRTDGLWWVQRADGAAIDDGVVDRLEGSDLVDWVSPAYRAAAPQGARATESAAPADTGVYAVNPTRSTIAGCGRRSSACRCTPRSGRR